MKKILSMLIIGIFLLSILPNIVSAEGDYEIQLWQSFHLGPNTGAFLEDIDQENEERLRLSVSVRDVFVEIREDREGVIGAPTAEISWMLTFPDNNEAMGNIPNKQIGGDIININGIYKLHILNINWDETEAATYVELRVDGIEEEIEPVLLEVRGIREGRDINLERVPSEQEEYSFHIIETESSQSPQVIEKQEALGKVVLRLKDYIKSTRYKIENSQSISDSEKTIFIEKLTEKDEAIEEYLTQIISIKNPEEVEILKSKLKAEIKEIKPIVEEPTIRIHKDKISTIINKIEILSKKLEKITSSLDTEDKNKINELKSLINSANKNIDKAQKLYNNEIQDTTEIKFLLRQATADIREAFRLVREILSDMERSIYRDLETDDEVYTTETIDEYKYAAETIDDDEVYTTTETIDEYEYAETDEGISTTKHFLCNEEYLMTWYNEEGNRIRQDEYNILEDQCEGFRRLSNNNEISPACYNERECTETRDYCLNIFYWKKICKNEDYIENRYIRIDESFELNHLDSAKLIDYIDGEQRSVIVTFEHLKEFDSGENGLTLETNYWEWSNFIEKRQESLQGDEGFSIGEYTINVLSIEGVGEETSAKLIIQRN